MSSPIAPEASISARLLTRLVVVLIALWSLAAGLVLVGFQGTASGALGAGINDVAGQRLVGAHLLILAPAYLLIAIRVQAYQGFLWLPFAGQTAIVLTVGYSILSGATSFGDGILAVAISTIFAGLLGFVWVSEQRSLAHAKLAASAAEDTELDDPEDASGH